VGNETAMSENAALAVVKETFGEFGSDKAARLAAAISYTAIFSIAPLFIIMIAIAGYFFGLSNGGHGHHVAQQQIVGAVSSAMGKDAGDTVNTLIKSTYSKPHQGFIASLISWIVFIVGAMGLFASLQDSLNTVWHVEPKKMGLWTIVRERAAALAGVIGIGLLLIISAIANAAFTFVSTYLTKLFPFPAFGALLQLATYVLSLVIVTILFAFIYKVLPDAKIAWSDVWLGAIVTAILFMIGQVIISLYIGHSGVSSTYSGFGSLLAILLWIYYSSMILLLGAEFTKVYAKHRGTAIAGVTA